MVRDIKTHKLFFIVTVILLFFSFGLNAFGAVSTDEFILNYKSSESLVTNQVRCEGRIYENQMLEVKGGYYGGGPLNECDASRLVPYISQFGLQGKVYTLGFDFLSNFTNISVGAYIAIVQLITALATAVIFGVLILWVRTRLGRVSAITLTSLLLISPMIVGFARNLYWATPLLILPLVFVLYFYRPSMSVRKSIFFWVILFVLFYLRYLCGYEYLTTLTIMALAAIVYHLYILKVKTKEYVLQIVIAGSVSVLAFIAAVCTHVISLNAYTGSTEKSLNLIQHRAEERTANADDYLRYPYANLKGLAGDHYKVTDTYLHYDERMESESKKWATIAAFSNYMLLPVVHLPITFASSFSLYVQSMAMFIIVLITLYLTRKQWVSKKMLRQVNGLFLASLIGLIGYFSWLILAYSHSLVHAHINGILMYLPFALFGYMIIGLYIEYLYNKFTHKRKK